MYIVSKRTSILKSFSAQLVIFKRSTPERTFRTRHCTFRIFVQEQERKRNPSVDFRFHNPSRAYRGPRHVRRSEVPSTWKHQDENDNARWTCAYVATHSEFPFRTASRVLAYKCPEAATAVVVNESTTVLANSITNWGPFRRSTLGPDEIPPRESGDVSGLAHHRTQRTGVVL